MLAATEVTAITATPSPTWRLRAEAKKEKIAAHSATAIHGDPPSTSPDTALIATSETPKAQPRRSAEKHAGLGSHPIEPVREDEREAESHHRALEEEHRRDRVVRAATAMRVARHTQQDERDSHHAHAQPLTPAQAESEVSLGEHGEQDESAGQHRLGQRQREQRQRRDVRDERDDGDGPPDGPPLRVKEIDRAAQRMAGVDVRCRDGPPVLEEEAQVRAERGQDRA